jgi:MFS family permease
MLGFEGDNAREKVIVLLTMCFALAMAMLDNTVVNVALPSIQKDAGRASRSSSGWSTATCWRSRPCCSPAGSWAIVTAARGCSSGLTIFTVFLFLCGVSQNPNQLIAFRVLQGIGGALLIPRDLSSSGDVPPHERAKALRIRAGVSGIALALGPTLGGYMVEHIGWQSVFFLNVPIGIVAMPIAVRTVTESVSRPSANWTCSGSCSAPRRCSSSRTR